MKQTNNNKRSQDISGGIAMGYELDDPGSNPSRVEFFSFPQHPEHFWGPPCLTASCPMGTGDNYLWDKVARA
jgi:hypothetical protein